MQKGKVINPMDPISDRTLFQGNQKYDQVITFMIEYLKY